MTSIVTATAINFSADCAARALFLMITGLERLRELQYQKAHHRQNNGNLIATIVNQY